ncbi:MAG: zinc-ribbon domain-containing protein [Oscillospiraceae bacterium]|nr:zinc-ribbon domain-containing protein [Oscillospiraceae bacterium]
MSFCIRCGAPLEEGAAFCSSCGARVESVPACPACGAALEEGAVFCANCGARVAPPVHAEAPVFAEEPAPVEEAAPAEPAPALVDPVYAPVEEPVSAEEPAPVEEAAPTEPVPAFVDPVYAPVEEPVFAPVAEPAVARAAEDPAPAPAPAPLPAFCTKCGAAAPAGMAFCTACGAPLDLGQAAALAAAERVPQAASQQGYAPPAPAPQGYAPAPVYGQAPAYQVKTNRSLGKVFWLGLITFGIYDIVFYSKLSTDANVMISRHDGKKTMHYCLVFFLFSWLTLGIVPLVWGSKLSSRLGRELARRGIDYRFGAGTFWGWNIFGSLILVGPFIYIHKLCKSANLIAADYNVRG